VESIELLERYDALCRPYRDQALRAGGRALVAVCAAPAFASVTEFVRERSTYSQDRVRHGARRVLELVGG
jgi:hypothetical protein